MAVIVDEAGESEAKEEMEGMEGISGRGGEGGREAVMPRESARETKRTPKKLRFRFQGWSRGKHQRKRRIRM